VYIRSVRGTTVGIKDFGATEAARAEAFSLLRAEALTLQRSILPEDTFQPEELEVSARYVPGVEGTEVGGDWYDVIPLGAGRVGLVIGDVMGRGMRAAAVMGQLRTAVRAYSRLDIPPAELLGLLDGLVAELKDEQIVTCTYAVYDPATRVMTMANAGHVPPIVVGPDRRARTVPAKVGAPLGVGIGVFTEFQLTIEPGTALVLYTDGLVESREVDIDSGIAALIGVFEQAIDDMERHCDAVLDQLGRAEGHDDDVALLVVRLPVTVEGSEVERLAVPRGVRSVRRARLFCGSLFLRWQLAREVADSARLVVNELVTNALLHGREPVELVLRRTATMLYVEVFDGSGQLPRRRLAATADERGRGLHLVASLSQRWGVRPVGEGKAVWVAMSLSQVP
jgi:anti-sigma regulatory factor (Ser/Thr protein kinase)